MKQDVIIVLDFGSKINTTVAREIRALGVYSEIHPNDAKKNSIEKAGNVKGLIISGEPGYNLELSDELLNSGLPILSVCSDIKGSVSAECWPSDSEPGKLAELLSKFVFEECHASANWNMDNFISDQLEYIKEQVGNKKVLLALSGGVDSSVVAALLVKAIGDNLICIHVNHGLMRKNESEYVIDVFKNQFQANLIYINASERFLSKLENVSDPEQKRKIIGEEFIRVFEEEAGKLNDISFLAQGTIYPDIIESGTKTAKLVKTHHNVGGLPEDLNFTLVEPLRQLFKDEVRKCGEALGLPHEFVYRQPFPGPGLGVRCLGAITRERLEAVRESDFILQQEFALSGLDATIWQYFTVIPDFKSVGVQNHERSFEYPIIIRAINTIDVITAEAAPLDWNLLNKIADRILKEVKGVNRVCYDLTPKPPGTVEWE